MKGKTGKHKAEGGSTGGDNEAEKDIKDKPENRNAPNKVASEAEELKKGGRAKKKGGGKVHVGKVEGEHAKMHAGRKPRKSGGSNFSPLSSAHSGKPAEGRKEMSESMD
jgi:hypothetical protein